MTLSNSRDPSPASSPPRTCSPSGSVTGGPSTTSAGCPPPSSMTATKTVVRKHVRRAETVPLHPEAMAFAAHYGFSIVVAPAWRPQFKGRVERQVAIVRHGVLDGRTFASPAEMDHAFATLAAHPEGRGPSQPRPGDRRAGRGRSGRPWRHLDQRAVLPAEGPFGREGRWAPGVSSPASDYMFSCT